MQARNYTETLLLKRFVQGKAFSNNGRLRLPQLASLEIKGILQNITTIVCLLLEHSDKVKEDLSRDSWLPFANLLLERSNTIKQSFP